MYATDDVTYDEVINKINEVVDKINEVDENLNNLTEGLKNGDVVPAISESADTAMNGVHFIYLDSFVVASAVSGITNNCHGSPDNPYYGTSEEVRNAAIFIEKLIKAFFAAKGKPIYLRSEETLTPKEVWGVGTEKTTYHELVNIDYSPIAWGEGLGQVRFNFKYNDYDLSIWCVPTTFSQYKYDCQYAWFDSNDGVTFTYKLGNSHGTVTTAVG